MGKLTYGKDGGMGGGGFLLTQEGMTDTDADKVDANTEADAPDASSGSKINTPKIDMKRGIGKSYTFSIAISWRVSLRQQAFLDSQSACGGTNTGKFDATIDAKKEAKKR